MTIEEFLALFETKVPKDNWEINRYGNIQRRQRACGLECPITAVWNVLHPEALPYSSAWWADRGRLLGLALIDASSIVIASDNHLSTLTQPLAALRTRLIAILGLHTKYRSQP